MDIKPSRRSSNHFSRDRSDEGWCSIFNVCEDSLLASPLIIDLVLIAELMTRISWRVHVDNRDDGIDESTADYKSFHSVLSVLSYMLKVKCLFLSGD